VVHYRRLVKYRELTPELRNKVKEGLEQWKSWFKQREEHTESINVEIRDTRRPEEIEKEKEVSERIKEEFSQEKTSETNEEEKQQQESQEENEQNVGMVEKILSPSKEYMISEEMTREKPLY